jgi:NitT/TauT family transport system permease protein
MKNNGLIRLIVIASFVAALEAACRLGLISKFTIIPPSEMLVALLNILGTPALLADIAASVLNIFVAAVMTIIVGFILGVVIHAVPRLREILDPVLSSYYALPLFAFYPLFIVIFGIGNLAIVVMGFLSGLAAMTLSTLDGLDSIPNVLNKVARAHRMGPVSTALQLNLPAAAPYLFTGVQLSIAYVFIGVIASEFILSVQGLGFAISYAYNDLDTKNMYGLILLVILLVTLLNTGLQIWDKRLEKRRRR